MTGRDLRAQKFEALGLGCKLPAAYSHKTSMYATGGVDFLDRLARAEARDAEYSQRAGERRMSSNDGGFMSQSSTKVMAPPGGKTSFSFGSDEAEIKSRMQQQGRKQNARWEAQQQDGWESQQQQAMIQQQMAVRQQQQQQQAQARAQQQARMAAQQQQQQQQQEDYEMAMMRQQHEQQMAAFQQQQAMRQQQQRSNSSSSGRVQSRSWRPRKLRARTAPAAVRRASSSLSSCAARHRSRLGLSTTVRPPSAARTSIACARTRQGPSARHRHASRWCGQTRRAVVRRRVHQARRRTSAMGLAKTSADERPGPGMASPHARGGSPRRPASPRRAASPGRGPNTPNSSTKVLAPPGGVSSISFG